MDYKFGQEKLQIVTALRTSNRSKKITNRGKEVLNRVRDYESGQERLQTGAGI